MEALILLVILAVLVYLANIGWRATETTLQGLVSGIRISWRIGRVVLHVLSRFTRWLVRWAHVLHLECAQRSHAAWWCWSYIWRRAYIAGRLRKGRRTGRYV